MSPKSATCSDGGARVARPRFEVADIFRAHGSSYRATGRPTPEQARVMNAIEGCRTAAFGGHVDVCTKCSHTEIAYNSCRNRHCPKCQCLAQARWLDQRKSRILPVPYFHVVFTLPAELRPVARANRRLIYNLLFRAASSTLLTLGRDPKRLDGTLGVTAVLHTWTRDLRFHPHLHCVVTGGALSSDRTAWTPSSGHFLFPVQVMSSLFRLKFMAALATAWRDGDLQLQDDDPLTFVRLRARLFKQAWVVYAKRPFAGPEQVFAYLGQYTHRVGISNHRILEVTPESVRIATKGGGQATLAPAEFIRRFLQHVLPRSFVKIRHYGLMASACVNTTLKTAAQRLAEAPSAPKGPIASKSSDSWVALLARLTGIDLRECPRCHQASMTRRASTWIRAPRGPP